MNRTYTEFTPYTNKDAGFSGVVPAGWIEKGPGEFGRGDPDTDPTFLVQLGVPGATVDLVSELLLPKIGLEALPERAGRIENANLPWDLYAVERKDPGASTVMMDMFCSVLRPTSTTTCTMRSLSVPLTL
jgi:hypothetical protein